MNHNGERTYLVVNTLVGRFRVEDIIESPNFVGLVQEDLVISPLPVKDLSFLATKNKYF